jgi:hypothetical protein
MIKDFKIFEAGGINMEYLIGLPSGQIIDVHFTEINNLKPLVIFNSDLKSYVFKDGDYETILKKLGRLNKTTKVDNDFLNHFFDSQRNVRFYKILDNGKIEVSGSIYVSGMNLKSMPFKFYSVTGDFIWRDSDLDTLEGSPEKVGKSFIVDNTNLFNLIGGPTYVGENYNCSHCVINSLEGSPKTIHGDFDCSDNFLTDLVGGPKIVKGVFDFSDNKYIKSLDGLPDCLNIIGNSSKTKEPVLITPAKKLEKEKRKRITLRDQGEGKFRW